MTKLLKTPFISIARHDLDCVSGGVTRTASGGSSTDSSSQLQLMISQIGDSIKSLAANNQKDSSSSMMMPMMMMMMGQGGGGGSAPAAPPPPPAGTFVKVNV
ncbi:hypothetical protein BH11MYX1_BH11MYX1_16470 [soil metagenome]